MVGHPAGGVDALDEYDAEDGEGGWHDGHDPGPGGKEAKDIAIDVLQEGLDTACSHRQRHRTTPRLSKGVELAFTRDRRPQLSHGTRTSPRQDTTNKPYYQRSAGRRDVRVNGTRRGEHAATNDDADDNGKRLDGAEVLRKGTSPALLGDEHGGFGPIGAAVLMMGVCQEGPFRGIFGLCVGRHLPVFFCLPAGDRCQLDEEVRRDVEGVRELEAWSWSLSLESPDELGIVSLVCRIVNELIDGGYVPSKRLSKHWAGLDAGSAFTIHPMYPPFTCTMGAWQEAAHFGQLT